MSLEIEASIADGLPSMVKEALSKLIEKQFLIICAALLLFVGCVDKASPDYGKCLQLHIDENLSEAWEACSAAIEADPNSESGKQAATKLQEMKPTYDSWKAAAEEEEAIRAEEAADRAAFEAEQVRKARAQQLAELQKRVRRERSDMFDRNCLGEGMPGRSYDFVGATYPEMHTIAVAKGCVRLNGYPLHNHDFYCCP